MFCIKCFNVYARLVTEKILRKVVQMSEIRPEWPGEILEEDNIWQKRNRKSSVNNAAKEKTGRYLLLVNSSQELGDKLKIKREELGKTQEEISRVVGVSTPTLSRIEQGKFLPSSIVLEKIGNIYNMSPKILSHVGACLKRGTNPLDQFIGVATEMLGVPLVKGILQDNNLDSVGKLEEIFGQLESKYAGVGVRNR